MNALVKFDAQIKGSKVVICRNKEAFMKPLTEPNYLRYGGAAKPTSEMSKEELEEMAEFILRRVKEKAFYYGRPIIYSEEGKVYREWQDGRIEIIRQ